MKNGSEIKALVRDRYAEAAGGPGGCCGPSCDMGGCFAPDYTELAGYDADADLGLGCGLPTADLDVKPGETVLDLGSGAGNDAFVVRALVGDTGRVIGVDMTPEMVEKARANAARLGAGNVEFVLGEIEDLPLPDASVDLVVSNCVLNLVPDKARAFAEMHRVLGPGGRFSVSDIVLQGSLPPELREAVALYTGCVAGAVAEDLYLDTIAGAGFSDVRVTGRREIPLPDAVLDEVLTPEQKAAFGASGVRVLSVTVRGRR